MTPRNHSTENKRLVALSTKSEGSHQITWPQGPDPYALYFSPELISLEGTDALQGIDVVQRNRLSLFEAGNFFSLNIHGEAALIAGLADRMVLPRYQQHREYLHHFLAEEVHHTAMFECFCQRYCGKVYPSRTLPTPKDEGEDGDVLFFARIAIFEEIVDAFNREMARDQRLAPVAQAVNRIHHLDEARHLSFGHRLLQDLVAARSRAWTQKDRTTVVFRLKAFIDQTWNSLFNPTVYRDAGLANAFELRRLAVASAATQRRRAWALRGCHRLLNRLGLTESGAA